MKMNTIKVILLFLMVFVVDQNVVAQKAKTNENLFSVTDKQIREYIEEVYQHETQMVLNHPQRFKDVNDLLKNRIKIYKMNEGYRGKIKDMKKLSSIDLLTFNNPDLKRDAFFNPKNFNPLKYTFDFYPRGTVLYNVNNTYVIVIISQQSSPSSRRK